jgi:hypothetical protein
VELSVANLAQVSCRRSCCTDPKSALTILEEAGDEEIREFGVFGDFAVLETREPVGGADPKRPVSRNQKAPDPFVRQMLLRWRLPKRGMNSVEAIEAKLSAEP